VEPLELQSKVRLLTSPANISLGRKWLTIANTLAYYLKESIRSGVSFKVEAFGTMNIILINVSN
jgi:hypothetical protein